jgi:threonine dehydrogenase-like Zn-dependent dehydrogenase
MPQSDEICHSVSFDDTSRLREAPELYPVAACPQPAADIHVIELNGEFGRRRAQSNAASLSKVAIVGLGYVGLPTSLAFHSAGATS